MRAVFEKLFARPVYQDFLVIPSRHPIQWWLMVSLLLAGTFQILQGPQYGTINQSMTLTVFFIQASMLVIGGLLNLWSAKLAIDKPWDSLGLSLAGMMLLAGVMVFYIVAYITHIPGFWAVSGFWFVFALFAGFVHRTIQLGVLSWKLWRSK